MRAFEEEFLKTKEYLKLFDDFPNSKDNIYHDVVAYYSLCFDIDQSIEIVKCAYTLAKIADNL